MSADIPQAATLRRVTASTWDDYGREVVGTVTDTAITLRIWVPASARTVARLNQGTRTRDIWEGSSPVEVRTTDARAGEYGDQLIVNGVAYILNEVHAWPGGGGLDPQWWLVAIRKTEAGGEMAG